MINVYINEERLNKIIFTTVVSAVQLSWESGLAIGYVEIKRAVLEALAVMMGDVIYEYQYVDDVIDLALDYMATNKNLL